ncbi:MFS transporter [Aneurinibacillus tyrosinisolvens]|uniref:MFS transporter n=1 Tax=Aneurinibacillus tyrosinisolvens TaxID=1443435 RepID=UPI00063F8F07|nr:MFS transporter [Aneurinibacillus tyrosinisolvens]
MKNKRFSFWLVGYSILTLMIGTNIPSPLYGIYKETMGFSSLILTLIFATYAIVLIPSLALFGKLSDRFGRKKVIWFGVMMSIIGSVAFAWANTIEGLFLARGFQGLAVGTLSGAATAALMELNPYEDKKIAALVASVTTAGGTALGPLIGGLIAQYTSNPFTIPYVLHLILAVPSILGILFMEETVHQSKQQAVETASRLPKNSSGPFLASAGTAFISWAVTALFMSIIPTYISTLLNIDNLGLLGGFVFLMLGSSVGAQFMLRRLRYDVSIKSGLLILAAGLIGISLAVPFQSAALLIIGILAVGIGQGLSFKGSMEQVNHIAPAHQRGAVVSKLYIVIYLGVGLPIIGVGTLATLLGLYYSILCFTSIITFLSFIMVFYLYDKLCLNLSHELHKAV